MFKQRVYYLLTPLIQNVSTHIVRDIFDAYKFECVRKINFFVKDFYLIRGDEFDLISIEHIDTKLNDSLNVYNIKDSLNVYGINNDDDDDDDEIYFIRNKDMIYVYTLNLETYEKYKHIFNPFIKLREYILTFNDLKYFEYHLNDISISNLTLPISYISNTYLYSYVITSVKHVSDRDKRCLIFNKDTEDGYIPVRIVEYNIQHIRDVEGLKEDIKDENIYVYGFRRVQDDHFILLKDEDLFFSSNKKYFETLFNFSMKTGSFDISDIIYKQNVKEDTSTLIFISTHSMSIVFGNNFELKDIQRDEDKNEFKLYKYLLHNRKYNVKFNLVSRPKFIV